MAALAAIRRYYKEVSLIWCDSDADLNTPATTPSGFLHGMVVGHIAGQGAPELVRFFKEPPLVREPDIALFGLSRIDPGEQKWMDVSPMRKFTPEEIRELGPVAAAEMALERIHIFKRQWALHFDVDVLAATEMPATYYPAENGLRGAEFAEALRVFVSNPNLAAITLASYVPSADADGSAAARLLDLFAEAMAARYRALAEAPAAPAAEASPAAEVKEPAAAEVKQPAAEEVKEPASTPAESSASETIAESEASVGDAAREAIRAAAAAASVESASEAASGAASDEVTARGTNDAASDAADESAGDPVSEQKSEGS
jgi:hypothetical protein